MVSLEFLIDVILLVTPYHFHVPTVLKSGSLNLLKPSGLSRPVMGLHDIAGQCNVDSPVLNLPLVCSFYLFRGHFLNLGQGKGQAIPLQAWTGPEDTRRLRLPDF